MGSSRLDEGQNQNWLPNPCLLGCPKSELVGPTSGWKCYITPAFSGIPKDMGDKIRFGGAHKWAEMLHHPSILGGPQEHGEQNQNWWGPQVGGNATSPLHSRGSPKTWGTKSDLVGPTSGQKCYITPAFLRVPKDMGDKIRIGGAHRGFEMLHHHCILGDAQRHGEQNQNWWGPQVGGNATSPRHSRGSPKTWATKSELVGTTSGWKCYLTPAFSGIPKDMGLNSELPGPTIGRKCYITLAFSGIPKDMGDKIRIGGVQKWFEMLHHPCILVGSPKTWGTKSELVEPTSGRKCYITPAFSGIPKDMGNKIRIGGAHKWAEMLHHPCILGDPQRHGKQNQNWWGPQGGGNATSPLHSRGSPKTWGTKSELVGPTSGRKCYITHAFSGFPKNMGDKIRIGGAHKWADLLHHPCILGDPQRTWGTKSELVGPISGRKCYITPAFSGVPKEMGDKIRIGGAQNWPEMLYHPCILGGPQRHGEQNQNWWRPQVGGNATSPLHSRGSPKDMGNKIRIGGAHKWAEMLHHPCMIGDPQRHGEQNQNWWGPQVGGNATSPLHSRGSPKTWGTKSELVRPTSGRKCYITPAFSGIPKDMGNKIRICGSQKWVEMLHHPRILGDPQRHGGQNQNWWGPQVGANGTSPPHSGGSRKT